MDDSTFRLTLSYRPPLDWESLIHFYKSHEIFGVENVRERTYQRVFKIDGTVGAVSVVQAEDDSVVHLNIKTSQTKSLYRIAQNVRQMLDLDSDPILISSAFASCKTFSKLSTKYPGLRIARAWDPFESAVCTILGQLVSVAQAKRLVRELVEGYGEEVRNPLNGAPAILFPSPERLANSSLSKVRTTQARKNAIQEFSRLISGQNIKLDLSQDISLFKKALLGIKGLGPWTAEYICLRALGDSDAFPATDLVLGRAMKLNPDIQLENLRPWRAYAAICLWKEYAKS